MRSLETLIRVQRRQLDQLRRDQVSLETLDRDLRDQLSALEREVIAQQAIASTDIEAGYGYPAFASKTVERRKCLFASLDDIQTRLEALREQVAAAYRDVKRLDIVLANRRARVRIENDRREQALLDEVGLEGHRRRRA